MYNEEAYLERAVAAAREVLETIAPDHEIIIVDDASTDRTGQLADALARADPRVKVLHNQRNCQLGGTLRAGYAAATKDLILYSDADLPFDFREVARGVRLLDYQQADVLAAYRFDRTSEGPLRTLYTLAYSALIRTLFHLRYRDVNFSFKLFRRSLLDRVALKSEGSFIDAEFLVRAKRAGASIIQIGVDYFPRSRGKSTLASPTVIVKILLEMARLWRELR
jgi:glycosyltransferase involved in cell wall biosynthesis